MFSLHLKKTQSIDASMHLDKPTQKISLSLFVKEMLIKINKIQNVNNKSNFYFVSMQHEDILH